MIRDIIEGFIVACGLTGIIVVFMAVVIHYISGIEEVANCLKNKKEE